MDGHPLILLKHGGPSRKKASLYGKVAQIYFALRGSFLLCAQHRTHVPTTLTDAASSPQIAWTFFRSASNAAVSAKAASLRRNSRSSSRMRLRSALVASDCRAAAWSDRSLACSQLARQRRICSGYRPRRRQYSDSSSSVNAAVSSTALNFCAELQPSVVGEAFGSNRPVLRACFRQLYIVAAEIPSSPRS